jgi:hypothetical protein
MTVGYPAASVFSCFWVFVFLELAPVWLEPRHTGLVCLDVVFDALDGSSVRVLFSIRALLSSALPCCVCSSCLVFLAKLRCLFHFLVVGVKVFAVGFEIDYLVLCGNCSVVR